MAKYKYYKMEKIAASVFHMFQENINNSLLLFNMHRDVTNENGNNNHFYNTYLKSQVTKSIFKLEALF